MSLEDSKLQCYQFTIAGQDTTAGLISSLIFHISSNPVAYSKLVSEITAYENDGKLSRPVVGHNEVTQMPFFQACLRETLRITPPASTILPRYVSKEGMTINGIRVPEKTELAANPYVIHRNQEVFGQDTDVFRPERWLERQSLELEPESQSEQRLRMMDKYDFAWGYGDRKCIGKNLAVFEAGKFCLQVFFSLFSFPLLTFNYYHSCRRAFSFLVSRTSAYELLIGCSHFEMDSSFAFSTCTRFIRRHSR